ncbi:hypothetical protein [Cupriavidus pampae]|uniref:Uncharacterized protein n=1 Tax=Cupriavidus pampae TaxID=659251 RepID=A0ABM8XUT6_9BURK|nr:hypothetical protein [Cupriavidus pampae]CAG9184146.1 hypothetical protein LMG32289_05538 [Cupriavidus pampae]
MSEGVPRAHPDAVLPVQYADPGLVGVDERLAWVTQVFVDRAVAHGGREGWEAWRIEELAATLTRQHALLVEGGASFDEALVRIDVMLTPKAGENT